jgi:hypothetical protein
MAGAHDHPPAGRVPFWIHQLVELLLGGLLLVEGARTGQHTAVLVSLGAVLLLLALCSDGALGAWPWLGRRAHRVLDLVAAAVLALSPLLLGLGHLLAIVVLEVAAVAMVWLALRTDWRTTPKSSKTSKIPASKTPPSKTRPPNPVPPPAPAAAPAPAEAPSSALARKLGTAVGRARDGGPRQLGRLVGRAHRAARAATANPGPSPDAAPEPAPGPAEGPDGASGVDEGRSPR